MYRETDEITSLCFVSAELDQKTRKPFYVRVADLIDGAWKYPKIDNNLPKKYENHSRLLLSNGPRRLNSAGVWKWYARTSNIDPNKDVIESDFVESLKPLRVVELTGTASLDDIYDNLASGIIIRCLHCDTVFARKIRANLFEGLMLPVEQQEWKDNSTVSLREETTIPSLALYEFASDDLIEVQKSLYFLKSPDYKPKSVYLVRDCTNQIIKDRLLVRAQRKPFVAKFGGTTAEWQKCRELLLSVCEPSFYEDVASRLNCSLDEAKKYVDRFANEKIAQIDSDDIEIELLKNLVKDPDIRSRCMELLKAAWEKENAPIITELESKKDAAKEELVNLEKQKQSQEAKLAEINSALNTIQRECDAKQAELKKLTALGNEALTKTRDKLDKAKKDVSGFWSDVAMMLPIGTSPTSLNDWTFTSGDVPTNLETEPFEDNGQLLDILCENLENAGVDSEYQLALAAYLLSIYATKSDVLLAGPNAKEIADAFCLTLLGTTAPVLSCSENFSKKAIESASSCPVLAVEGAFSASFQNRLTTIRNRFSSTMMIWLHSFAEDLCIEPRGILNYVLPVLTELLIAKPPASGVPVSVSGIPEQLDLNADAKYRAKLQHLEAYQISKLTEYQLSNNLQLAKALAESNNHDMEFMFGHFPVAVITSKLSVLEDRIEDSSVSERVKAAIARLTGIENEN